MKKYQSYLTVNLPPKRAKKIQCQCDEDRPLFSKPFGSGTVGEVIRTAAERAIQAIIPSATVELTGEGLADIQKEAPEVSESIKAVINSIRTDEC
jgi:hypothetical protein